MEKAITVKNKKGRKPDDQKSFINLILTSVASTPTSDNKSKCSFKQFSDIIPQSSRYRLCKEGSKKRKK